jgi:EmrB/QacA subfamily drug resistance transporter
MGPEGNRALWVPLGAMGLAIFVVANDFTALSVALPVIERDLDAELSTVQWVVNAYSLVFGVLTVTGGRLADLLGRRRMFVVGATIFAFFSLVAALAPDVQVLIAARALMAIGGALMWPATLGMTYAILPPERKGLAGGLILGVIGLGNAAGPLIGGLLTDVLDWRYVLAVNVPVAAVAVTVVLATVSESRGEDEDRRFDWAGMGLLTSSLVALLVALDQVSAWGWGDARVVGLLSAALLLMVLFVLRQRGAGMAALIPSDVAGNAAFRVVVLAVLFMSMTFFTALVYLPQFMEKLLGFSPLEAGLGMLPVMLVFGGSSFVAGPLYGRLGGRRVLLAGATCLPLGMLALSFIEADSSYATLVPGMALLGLGTGLFYSAATTAAISSLAETRASLASGILYMLQVAGGSVGLGVATTIASGAETFVDGLQATLRVSAALAAVGLIVVAVSVRPARLDTAAARE